MLRSEKSQLIRLFPLSGLARDLRGFLVDRQARGLSPRTIQFYQDELNRLSEFLEGMNIAHVEHVKASHLRSYLLHLGETRNPGGIHAAYRAMKAFFRWWDLETEPDHLLGLLKRGNIAFQCQGFSPHFADLIGISLCLVCVLAVGQADVGPFAGEFQGGRSPDSLGTSCYERIFPFQQHKTSLLRPGSRRPAGNIFGCVLFEDIISAILQLQYD